MTSRMSRLANSAHLPYQSVCLDLESYLIRMFAGDGVYRNDGITEADYYERSRYRETSHEFFDQFRRDGVFTRRIPEIENSDLFKLSPFKALSQDQAMAVDGIREGLSKDLAAGTDSTIVVQGDPGTGKTVVAIYLLKLIVDNSKFDSRRRCGQRLALLRVLRQWLSGASHRHPDRPCGAGGIAA